MELADPNLLQDLLRLTRPSRKQMPKRAAAPPTASQPARVAETAEILRKQRRLQGTRCRCGRCGSCLENARWERIYREKFADPNYYAPRIPPHASSLASRC
jgi:uncharacterized protein with PIN domain